MEIATLITVIITLVTIGLFFSDKVRADLVAIIAMVSLMLTQVVTPQEGLSGFSDPAVITVLSMFILSAAIQKTGIIRIITNRFAPLIDRSLSRQLILLALITIPLSAFISNTATVAILIPVVFSLSQKAQTSPSQVLIPISFWAQLAGMFTIIGTTPNIIANSIIADFGMEPFSLFALAEFAAIAVIFGVIYFLTLGRLLLPKGQRIHKSKPEVFHSQLQVERDSSYVGTKIQDLAILKTLNIEALSVLRNDHFIGNADEIELQEHDIIITKCTEEAILEILKIDGLKIMRNFDPERRRLRSQGRKVARIAVASNRSWINKPLEEVHFHSRFNANILGIKYRRAPSSSNLGHCSLHNGDILLVAANERTWEKLSESSEFVFLDEVESVYQPEKLWITLGIFAAVITPAALGILPIVTAALTGVILLILTRCIRITEIYRMINWQVVFLLACIIPLGIAFEKTGLVEIVSTFITTHAHAVHPLLLLMIFFFVTTHITEFISNIATVVLLTPIAITTALQLGYDPYPFVAIIMFASSNAFLTPVGYQTNTMVYTAGGYKFSDFFKAGLPLGLILNVVIACSIYFLWGV